MGAWDDPRYKILAQRAATLLGTSDPKIVNAILAQWRCEIGSNDMYPPTRNNPGNLTQSAAESINFPYTVAPGPNPQPGNPIVTFSTPEVGADAYGTLLATLPRYEAVRDAVAAGDPYAFFDAIVSTGYGSKSTVCMRSVYRDPADEAPVSLGPKPKGATAWVEAVNLARIFSADSKGILRPITFPFNFEAWVGPRVTRTWAPGPKSKVRSTAVFRKILSGAHINKFIRITDAGTTWHEQ